LVTTQCDAPVTASPPVAAAPTPLEGSSPEDELEELVELLEVEEVPVLADEVAVVPVAAVVLDDVPGMVAALTALKTPTAATAANAAPTVSRFRSRRAASRARMRCSECVLSMVDSLAAAARPNAGEGCEVPEEGN
jgi:hypothetical protein